MAQKVLRIELGALILAMQSHEPDEDYYLDLESGAVEAYIEGKFRGEEVDIDDVLDEEPDRYLFIEGVPSARGYKVMEKFIEDVAPLPAKTPLWRAIEGKKPFRQFKDALLELGDLKEAYAKFEKDIYTRFAQDWLKSEGIAAELFEAPKSPE
jgi:hypothetical protein